MVNMNIRQLRLVHASILTMMPFVNFVTVIPRPLVMPEENHHTLFILVNMFVPTYPSTNNHVTFNLYKSDTKGSPFS